jgi:glucosamine--fructose-6-phosphate aminotransferase (isomerizing)
MCGIIGYIGNKNSQNYLLSGLKRLEYRGYDSAGIVTLDQKGTPTLLREKGKIANLETLISQNKTTDRIGIGHTRWATHGIPSVKNAHPHRAGKIYLVHNGIIENYKALKSQLKLHKFRSDTDTEVLAALINSFYSGGKYPLENAVVQALKLVRGTYGLAAISQLDPQTVVVARSGSPLVIGIGQNETLIASDASALIGYTKKAIYLNDGEIAKITAGNIDIKTLSAEPVSAKVEQIETNLATVQKSGYDHFLLKEIMEQPTSLAETLRGRIAPDLKSVHLGGPKLSPTDLQTINHLIIVGCGTAYHAGLLAAYYIEQFVPGLTIEVVIASEYRYRPAHVPQNTLALIVSQSGETADTLACLRDLKIKGAKTIGIINAIGSTIAREVDGGTYIHVGPEISVASTKAFTSQFAAMLMFGLTIAAARQLPQHLYAPFIKELAALPKEIEKLTKSLPPLIKPLAKKYAAYDHAIYLGRDTAYPAALEGALKLKEISYIDANAYPAGELKHGPLALVDDRFFEVFLLPAGELFEKSISNLQEVLARSGHILAITNSPKPITGAESTIAIKTSIKHLSPILLNIATQFLAYFIAAEKNRPIDHPRNLAKSVTVE